MFAGTLVDDLDGIPPTRICTVDIESGNTRVLTFGPNTDRSPKWSPNGRCIAFLSDRHQTGDVQLYLIDLTSGAVSRTPPVDGWVEYLHWSPDGKRILLGVAGHGADVSGRQGAVTSKQVESELPPWLPTIETGEECFRWRSIWIYDIATHRVCQLSTPAMNIWEATWCGNGALVAVVSQGPQEGLWYSACVRIIALENPIPRDLYAPTGQIACPAACASGKYVAILEGLASDRMMMAGELRIIESSSREVLRADTRGVDVTYVEWRSDRHLLLAGHRGFETVVGLLDVIGRTFIERWVTSDLTSGRVGISVAGLKDLGDCVLVSESFKQAPQIAVIRQGRYEVLKSFDLGYNDQAKVIRGVDRVHWSAPDGLEIQGWLIRPAGTEPYPLVMHVHGGPVWQWRPTWLGRSTLGLTVLMLLKRGYAAFLPNPRGSSGRGQSFAQGVLGEMGGADTWDYLSGLDHLVDKGIADPGRLGVTGGSYGGFMTAWLITQDSRFAAAVPVAPATNHVSEHLTSNIPSFVAMFLGDQYRNPGGKYFSRSPIMHAHRARTPTLNICGALDRCTPPGEARQFHNALLENGVRSVLITYPQEGHGIRALPAAIDYVARVVHWFEEHMPAKSRTLRSEVENSRTSTSPE